MTTENSGEAGSPGRFKPGVSGNPGGRPKRTREEVLLAESARASSKEALDVVLDIMNNGSSERVRLTAAIAIIERGCGKPGETVTAPVALVEGANLADQARRVLAAAMEGDLTIPQSSALISAIGALAKIIETDELAARITALEAKHSPQGGAL